jgi:hypothetical protein
VFDFLHIKRQGRAFASFLNTNKHQITLFVKPSHWGKNRGQAPIARGNEKVDLAPIFKSIAFSRDLRYKILLE